MQFYQDEDNTEFKMEGPLIASLRSFVIAVAVEEDVNTYRKNVMEQVQKEQSIFLGCNIATKVPESHPSLSGDMNLVIGLLK